MLIPKCCKNCSGRKKGTCSCALPSYCNEWVEDDETYPTNVGGVINTPNTAPSDIKIGDPYPCGSDGTNTELQKNWWNGTWRNYEQRIDNWVECPDCKEKDHRIAVLEKALKNTCWLLYGTYDEHYPNCFIKQAEKELEG